MKYTIGEFAQLTGLSIYTLRYYEAESLITPKRLKNKHRLYDEQDLAWIAFIKRLKETNMPIKDIKRFALLRSEGEVTMDQRAKMLKEHEEHLKHELQVLTDHLEHIQEKIQYYMTGINK